MEEPTLPPVYVDKLNEKKEFKKRKIFIIE
jgi:hypothetical protein